MKLLKLLITCSIVLVLSACGSTSSTTQSPTPVNQNEPTGPSESNPAPQETSAKKELLNLGQITKVKMRLKTVMCPKYKFFEKDYNEKLTLMGPILSMAMQDIFVIDWERISATELITLVNFFFDHDLNLLP